MADINPREVRCLPPTANLLRDFQTFYAPRNLEALKAWGSHPEAGDRRFGVEIGRTTCRFLPVRRAIVPPRIQLGQLRQRLPDEPASLTGEIAELLR